MKHRLAWKVGDKFTTPDTGDRIFSVTDCWQNDVDAIDARSRSGVSSFAKDYIIPYEDVKQTQTEIEIAKYDTLAKIVVQLEGCNYECEAGHLNSNVAFLALKGMAKK